MFFAGSYTVYIQTTTKQLKSTSVLKMQIKRTDTSIIIKGIAKVGVGLNISGVIIKENFQQVYYVKSKMNIHNKWFLEIDKIPKQISSNVIYQKR